MSVDIFVLCFSPSFVVRKELALDTPETMAATGNVLYMCVCVCIYTKRAYMHLEGECLLCWDKGSFSFLNKQQYCIYTRVLYFNIVLDDSLFVQLRRKCLYVCT